MMASCTSPTVSVVIPTYNHRDFVLQAVESVFRQSFRASELIIVNDGSTDDTASVLHHLADRIHYIEQPNGGQAAARNRGLSAASGEFVALLDDDDLWPPDKLEWQVAALRSVPEAVLVYGNYRFMGERAAPHTATGFRTEYAHSRFLRRNWILSPGQTLIRRSALAAVGGLDPAIWGADDWDLYVRLARLGQFIVSERLALWYRIHLGNASADAERLSAHMFAVRRRHIGRFPRRGYIREWYWSLRFVRGYSAALFCKDALAKMERGEVESALRSWWRGLTLHPGFLRRGRLRRLAVLCLRGAVWNQIQGALRTAARCTGTSRPHNRRWQ